MGECVISSVLSHHNKNLNRHMGQHYSPWMDQCYSSWMGQHYSSMLQLSFIQKVKENTSLRQEGMPTQKTEEKRGPPRPILASLFMFSHLPLGLPYVNWAIQECCLFYPRSSLWSSDLPVFYFCGIFPSLSFSHRHSGLLFPILTT